MTTVQVPWQQHSKIGFSKRRKVGAKSRAGIVKRRRRAQSSTVTLRLMHHPRTEEVVDAQVEPPPSGARRRIYGNAAKLQQLSNREMFYFAGHEHVDARSILEEGYSGAPVVSAADASVVGLVVLSACHSGNIVNIAPAGVTKGPHEIQWDSIANEFWKKRRRTIGQSDLTNADRLLTLLESEHADAATLVLFAESLPFDADQQSRLLPHLVAFVERNRSTTDSDELVALGSAIRKLIAYLPLSEFDTLSDLLGSGVDETVAKEAELELAKGIVYRLSWDEADRPQCPRLCDDLYDLAMFHSSKRVVDSSSSAAIALNATIALAFLGDDRALNVAATLPRRSMAWFLSLVKTRVRRLVSKWQKEKRSQNALGLLPDLLDTFQ